MSPENPAAAPEPAPPPIAEVRYRLPELLAELRAERSAGLFAQERFSQREIERIFQARRTRHGKRAK
jgi:hypothetical protein